MKQNNCKERKIIQIGKNNISGEKQIGKNNISGEKQPSTIVQFRCPINENIHLDINY